MSTTVIIWTLTAVIAGAIGAMVGQRRGRQYAGFWWGFLLGPLGWLIVALGRDLSASNCVHCGAKWYQIRLCTQCGKDAWTLG